jgi:hypothetical protein
LRWLLFLSRLCLICGVAFLLSLSLLYRQWIPDGGLASTIITIGYFMGMVIVPITLLCYLFLWIAGKKPATVVRPWLIIANLVVLLLLLAYIYYVNYRNAQLAL